MSKEILISPSVLAVKKLFDNSYYKDLAEGFPNSHPHPKKKTLFDTPEERRHTPYSPNYCVDSTYDDPCYAYASRTNTLLTKMANGLVKGSPSFSQRVLELAKHREGSRNFQRAVVDAMIQLFDEFGNIFPSLLIPLATLLDMGGESVRVIIESSARDFASTLKSIEEEVKYTNTTETEFQLAHTAVDPQTGKISMAWETHCTAKTFGRALTNQVFSAMRIYRNNENEAVESRDDFTEDDFYRSHDFADDVMNFVDQKRDAVILRAEQEQRLGW